MKSTFQLHTSSMNTKQIRVQPTVRRKLHKGEPSSQIRLTSYPIFFSQFISSNSIMLLWIMCLLSLIWVLQLLGSSFFSVNSCPPIWLCFCELCVCFLQSGFLNLWVALLRLVILMYLIRKIASGILCFYSSWMNFMEYMFNWLHELVIHSKQIR